MSAGAYGRQAAARMSTVWVTGGLRFGLDDAPGVDGDLMALWCDTVGETDHVWILGGLGDPEFYDGLPGRIHFMAGPGDPMSVWDLVPDLAERKQVRGVLDEIETERARLVEDARTRGGLAWVWTGYGCRYDEHKGIAHPLVTEHLIIRGRKLSPTGTVDGTSVLIDPMYPQLHRLEDV